MSNHDTGRISSGVEGLDEILDGGLIRNRAYLVRGGPGSGKTTLGFQFLTDEPDEPALFITMGEHVDQLKNDAQRQGFDISSVSFLDLAPATGDIDELESYSLMAPSEAEENSFATRTREVFESVKPKRIFIDSLSHLSYLAPDAFHFRKQVIALLRYFTRHGATVMSSAELSAQPEQADELQFLADGIIQLGTREHRRVLSIIKFRGSDFVPGHHTIRIDATGMVCYPRLIPAAHGKTHERRELGTGIKAVDALLNGGLTKGTVNIITGPTGVGKTTLGMQFIRNAAERGERGALYTFEENLQTLRYRAEATGIPFRKLESSDFFHVESIEPLRYSADEFTSRLRHEVETRGTSIVMVDSLSGYRLSIADDDIVQRVLALSRYLTNMGVTVILVNEVSQIAGNEVTVTETRTSFLADTVVMLRYMEIRGELRKAIGVLKKRTGDFEKTLREFEISPEGIVVGEPLTHLRGILRGNPDFDPEDRAGSKPGSRQ